MTLIRHLTNQPTRLRVGFTLFALLVIGAAIIIQTPRAYGYDQDIAKLNRSVQTKGGNAASMQIFREGRDLIEAQNWAQAAAKFKDFIAGYPKDKDIDAALYWYGYALQKQGSNDGAKVPLLRLITNYPNSTWRREAEALLVVLGEQGAVNSAIERDRCEIKMLALQSLFQADQDRAINVALEALKSPANQCPGFAAAAVSLLGAHGGPRAVPILLEIARSNPDLKLRLTAIRRLGDQHNDQVTEELIKFYDADGTKEIRTQVLRALVESRSPRGTAKVLEIARTGDDVAMRTTAIKYIGELKDPGSLDELIRIYDSDKTTAIRVQVLRALSEREDPRARAKILEVARQGETPELRIEAIRRLADHGRLATDDLLQLYSSETNLQIKLGLLRALADIEDPRARAKVLEVARGNEAIELRTYAIRQLGGQDDEQTVDQLIAIYGSEQTLQIKGSLLRAFGDSKQKSAVRKLMDIARNDPSVELRKMAVQYLGQSKDPEALKFLEELLK
jgi:HEAT repeat protein